MNFNSSPQCLSLTPTGVILLDVENFPFKLDLGQVLKSHCEYPITIKFAVANWLNSSVAKLDKYLHSTGYQLIHVPKEKNAADAQILTLGASLKSQYPQAKEIVVVSGDSIFDYLHQTLQRQGYNTYKVYQHSGNVYLHNFLSDRSSIITRISNHAQQSIEQKISTKIELTLSELTQKSQQKVTLSQLSQEFKVKYKQSISNVLANNKLPKSTLGFITKSCANKIDIEPVNNIHYLSFKN